MFLAPALQPCDLPPRPLSSSARSRARYAFRVAVISTFNATVSALLLLLPSTQQASQLFCPFTEWHAAVRRRLLSSAYDFECRRRSRQRGVAAVGSTDRPPFGYGLSTAARPLVASMRVSLPSAPPCARLTDLLPPDVGALLASPSALLREQPATPLVLAPRVFGARTEYLRLVARLWALGLLRPVAHVAARVGLFCTDKPDGRLRLIIDARAANALLQPPPHVVLPTPTDFADLEVPADYHVACCNSDLESFYYNMLIPPWLSEYFVVPRLSVAEAGAIGCPSDLGVAVLPMGFSWAVYLGQAAHLHVTSGPLAKAAQLPGPERHLLLSGPCKGLYIDDLPMLAPVRNGANGISALQALQKAASAAYQRHGLPENISKRVPPTTAPVQILGIEAHGARNELRLSAERCNALLADTRALLSLPAVSGRAVQQLLGRWIWPMLLVRPALSAFGAAFEFVRRLGARYAPLWPSVVSELRIAMGLAPLLVVHLDAPWIPFAVACDASTEGLGVCGAPVTPVVARHAARINSAAPTSAQVIAARTNHVAARWPWRTWIAARWRYPGVHNNPLEAAALITAVRRAATSVDAFGRRLLLFGDNTAVLAAAQHGRSSSKHLRQPMRTLAAWLLATGIRLYPRFIGTSENPADGPSRGMRSQPTHRLPSSQHGEQLATLLPASHHPASQ